MLSAELIFEADVNKFNGGLSKPIGEDIKSPNVLTSKRINISKYASQCAL